MEINLTYFLFLFFSVILKNLKSPKWVALMHTEVGERSSSSLGLRGTLEIPDIVHSRGETRATGQGNEMDSVTY